VHSRCAGSRSDDFHDSSNAEIGRDGACRDDYDHPLDGVLIATAQRQVTWRPAVHEQTCTPEEPTTTFLDQSAGKNAASP
jgi:hypothetical protein